ncbi:hypothetical protein WA026_023726 [Henosepilachna vigintioctopunctata]|uniref:Fas-binding factor 1 C-terminal domain-containing protein n=1 Tax=Henosepilachna vigintioctopunctata TaxID=420089 RepID=A0AAW1V4I9_9CUCU
MNFGDDDLLADILSDGSDDSFFDDPKVTRRKSTIKNPDKSKEIEAKPYDHLSSVTSNIDSGGTKTNLKTDWLGLGNIKNSEVTSSPSKSKKPIKKISFDDEDILGTLGLNKRLPNIKVDETQEEGISGTKAKKSEFLESILKPNKKDEVHEVSLKSFHPTDVSDTEKNTNINSTLNVQKYTSESNVPRENRRKRILSGLVDPLGLFSDESKNEFTMMKKFDDLKHTRAHSLSSSDVKDIDNLSSNKSTFGDASRSAPNLFEPQSLPDWLGESSKLKSSGKNWGSVPTTESKSELTLLDKSENAMITEKHIETTPQLSQSTIHPMNLENTDSQANYLNPLFVNQKMAQSHMEYQSTAITLQQQESQILMALQMKKYEDNLNAIQRQQQEILNKQEQQFSSLLERQFMKQQAMENNMKLQQERINNHIQLLLAQPKFDISKPPPEDIENAKQTVEENQVKAYENLISCLKQRQHEEIFILEESYKKQISILEETAQKTENRLKLELETTLLRNEEYVKNMMENHDLELNKLRKKNEETESEHAKEIKMIRENHMRVIDEMRNEHNVVVENIREFMRSEATIQKDSGEFGQKLETNIQLLFNNSNALQNMSDKIGNDYGVLTTAREETLKAREKEIEMMRNTLNKCRESAETERTQLLGLVASLETKIAEQNQAGREELWTLKQAMSTLAARSAAFDRETEFSRASIEKEREQLKALKESMLADQERIMLQLTEEKLTISAAKSRLETTSKLNVQYDVQKAKAELDAAMEVAREAAEMTDREREALQKQLCEVESRKRNLQDRERKLASREIELTRLVQAAEAKSQEGEKALEESKIIEMRCNDRMKQLQFQLTQLSNREKKITEEKIALSKERIALNTLIQQKKWCTLCGENQNPENMKGDWNNDFIQDNILHFPRFDVSEAELIRLQFEDREENPISSFKNS